MEELVQILYLISTALLIPVILTLIAFLAWSFLEIGGILSEYIDRRRGLKHWKKLYSKLNDADVLKNSEDLEKDFFGKSVLPGFLGKFSCQGQKLANSEQLLSKLSSDLEIEISGRLSKMSLGTRLGPMLGLMGTLIPLGPALIGLATGNIQEMAQNLVVAFSTTVLGLAVGTIFFIINLTRRKWYAQDISDIEFVTDCLFQEETENGVEEDAKQKEFSTEAF